MGLQDVTWPCEIKRNIRSVIQTFVSVNKSKSRNRTLNTLNFEQRTNEERDFQTSEFRNWKNEQFRCKFEKRVIRISNSGTYELVASQSLKSQYRKTKQETSTHGCRNSKNLKHGVHKKIANLEFGCSNSQNFEIR